MAVDGEVDGLREFFRVEAHQLAGCQRHRREAERRHVPATGREIEGIDHPAVDLIGERDGGDQVGGARPFGFRHRKAGRDMVARMRRKRSDIDVVEVVIAERGAIGESREIGRGARIGADHGGGAAAPGRQCHLAANPHRQLAERRNAAADGVDHMRL